MALKDRKNTPNVGMWVALPALCCSAFTFASPTISVSAETRYTDNADKSESSTAFDEYQNSIETNIGWAKRFNARSDLTLDYDIVYETFSEDSSEDEFSFNGSSSYNFILSKNLTGSLEHSIKQLLRDASAAETRDNLDERNIYSAEVTATFTPSTRHSFLITPSIEEIRYSDSDTNDSSRFGVEGSWKYLLDSSSDISFNISRTEIEYESGSPDQKYDKVSLIYNKSKRLFTYFADVGFNRYTSGTNNSDDPFATFKLTYDDNTHRLGITASHILTDSSFGDGNQNDLNSNIDGNTQTIDQLSKESLKLSYGYQELCKRCDLNLEYEINDEEYINTPNNNFTETIITSNLSYQIDRTTTIELEYSISDIDYSSSNTDYDLQEVLISYSQQFNRLWHWTGFTEYESKDANQTSDSYSEFVVGFKVGYQFK